MDDYCPLCRKGGNYKKIRAIQVNYDEAVWLCEEEQCPWPYGYEEFKFIPRRVDELSKKFPSKAEVNKHKESTSISTELGVYTPPVTPSNEASSTDSGKIDNLGLTPPNNIHSTFIGKISPTYRSKVVPTAQTLKEQNSQASSQNIHDKWSKPVSSIFDIDSSVSVGKIEHVAIKRRTGPAICDGKQLKQEVESKIIRKKLKHVPQIRSIQTIPNDLIKIEVKEDLSTHLLTPTIVVSPLKGKNEAPPRVTSTPQAGKRLSIPEINKLNDFNSITEVPKKILKVSDDDTGEKIVANKLTNPSEATNPQDINAQIVEDQFLQSNNHLEIINFEGGNNSMDNSGQVGFNGILEEMLMGNCQNVTQEIDDDWLNSMLV